LGAAGDDSAHGELRFRWASKDTRKRTLPAARSFFPQGMFLAGTFNRFLIEL
jgi:hypothetical protein